MNYLYAIPWFIWIAWFVAWEAWGFYRRNDQWPTFSQLWKWWETPKETIDSQGHKRYTGTFSVAGGISTWSWFRWFTAIGLPVTAFVLELHWVWEVF